MTILAILLSNQYLGVGKAAEAYYLTPWQNKGASGLQIQTKHYTIYTTIQDPCMMARVANIMEAAHRSYNQLLPHPVEPKTRSQVYLFASRHEWEQFIIRFAGQDAASLLRITNGAVCHNGTCIAYYIGPDQTLSALTHEGWHQFASRHFAFRLPSWLDEGLAMMFEAFRQGREGIAFCPDANRYRLEGLSLVPTTTDLDDLLSTSPGEMLSTDRQDRIQGLYSRWYCLMMFLWQEYPLGLRRMVHDGFLGLWPLEGHLAAVAADRNRPRTIMWNRVVGPWVFHYYICNDTAAIHARFERYCTYLASRQTDTGVGL
ncbi:MAG: hypothetical protein QHH07_00050 [Sedimentisphaerales bacterium]|nr:hypothetical protein [Sedimentisphaerales bacterium]